jgi:hypothetical protein
MITPLGPVTAPGSVGIVTAEIPPGERLLSLNPGDTLRGLVLKAGEDHRVLIQLGDQRILADARTALKPGQELVLRVEETGPQTVLRILAEGYPETKTISQYLILNRANPQALRDLFTVFKPDIDAARLTETYPETIRNDLRKLGGLMDSLVFSQRTLDSPGFVKDYIHGLGLLLENGLFRALDNTARPPTLRAREGLKGGLQKLVRLLNEMAGDTAETAPGSREPIINLMKQSERSITALEIQQVINVLSQDEGSPYLLPIPMAFPDGIRFQQLYIEKGPRRASAPGEIATHRFVLFLDLDVLGEMMADVKLTGVRVSCRLKCREAASQLFLAPLMSGLTERMTAAGLEVVEAVCQLEPGLTEIRQDYRDMHRINNREALNLFA